MFAFNTWLGAPMLLALSLLVAKIDPVRADNPIVQTVFTADPAPIVHNDRLYIFTSHDEDTANNWYDMRDWRLFSTVDMVNWEHHASPMSLETFPWVTRDAWAGQVVPCNGKFYYYVPIGNGTWDTFAIGVGVSDNIEGPYVDAIGGPLLANGGIDPTVYIDNDGQAYMYWGNPDLYWVKLNSDMVSYSGQINRVNLTPQGFGDRGNGQTNYQEGPWFYKRDGLYYMVFSAICCPQNIQYSTSTSPTGPWTHRGVIMNTGAERIETNHVGLVEFRGKDYFFYHDGKLPGGGSFKRSASVESFSYNADGSIPLIPMTKEGPAQIALLNPYVRTKAATMAFSGGIETEVREGRVVVAFINNGDYIKVRGLNFGGGAKKFTASVASATSGGNIEVRLDRLDGPIVGTCSVAGTGGWEAWRVAECSVNGAVGARDLFLKFTGVGSDYLFNIEWWQFA